jgi:hypothetical protein
MVTYNKYKYLQCIFYIFFGVWKLFYKHNYLHIYNFTSYTTYRIFKNTYTRDGTPYECQKWASEKSVCGFPLLQMWNITPDVTVKCVNRRVSFQLFKQLYKIQFKKKKSKCDSSLLTLLYITHLCFGFVCSFHRDILSVVGCVQKLYVCSFPI